MTTTRAIWEFVGLAVLAVLVVAEKVLDYVDDVWRELKYLWRGDG